MAAIETSILNKIRDLARMPELVERFAAEHQLSPNVVFGMNVALDEMLSNIIKYGYADDAIHEIRVRLCVDGPMLVFEIEDDGLPFDPCAAPGVDTDTPIEDRRVGGLGIHIVRNLMAQMDYARVGDRNRLVMRMPLAEATQKGMHAAE